MHQDLNPGQISLHISQHKTIQKRKSGEQCHEPAHHMGRFECSDKLAGLLVVSVSGEGNVVYRHLQLQLLARHGGDLLRLRHDVLHKGIVH